MSIRATYSASLLCLFLGLGSSLFAQDAKRYMAAGDSLVALGKELKAIAQYELAIDAGAQADGYSAKAAVWYQLDRMDRFILDVETALDFEQGHPQAHYQRALYAMRSHDWSLAKSSCDRALKAGIKDELVPEVKIIRGEAQANLGTIEPAIDDLREGLDAGAQDIQAMRILAGLYHDIDLHESAITTLTELLMVDSSELGDRINLGYEKALLGRHREAIEDYRKVLRREKNNPIALSNYAFSLYKLGKNEDAMSFVKKSLRSQPGNPHAIRTRAMLYLSAGEKEKACKDLYGAKIAGDFKDLNALIKKHCLGIKR